MQTIFHTPRPLLSRIQPASLTRRISTQIQLNQTNTPTSSSTTPATSASTSTPTKPSYHHYTPAKPYEWGPNTRELIPSLPRVVSRSRPLPGVPKLVRKKPLKYTRLTTDYPLSKTQQYDLYASVIVERWPKIMKDEAAYRVEYREHFQAVHQRKRIMKAHVVPDELLPKAEDLGEQNSSTFDPNEAVDPADLLTEADRANDLHATHRCLQESLFLVVKKRGTGWQFPSQQVPFDVLGWDTHVPDPQKVLTARTVKEVEAAIKPPPPKDTLRSVAGTAISSTIGTHAGVYFMGNAPIAVHRVMKTSSPSSSASSSKFSPSTPTATPAPTYAQPGPRVVGSKYFFMHALYMDGEIRLQNPKEYDDYAWIKKSELSKYIGQEQADVLQTVLLEPSV